MELMEALDLLHESARMSLLLPNGGSINDRDEINSAANLLCRHLTKDVDEYCIDCGLPNPCPTKRLKHFDATHEGYSDQNYLDDHPSLKEVPHGDNATKT